MSIKVFQLHKPEASAFKEIQDRLNISKDRKVIALADGTTQGHQSELWAQHLVDEFVNNPVFTHDNLLDLSLKECALASIG